MAMQGLDATVADQLGLLVMRWRSKGCSFVEESHITWLLCDCLHVEIFSFGNDRV